MKRKANGHDRVEVIRPFPHRPDLLIVRLDDGRQRVFGDYAPLNQHEFIVLRGGLAESTTKRLEYTEEEQTALQATEDRLQRAATLYNELWDDSRRINGELDAIRYGESAWGERHLTEKDRDAINRLEQEARGLQGPLARAHKLHHEALIGRNRLVKRIQAAATARQHPIQLHHPAQSTEERLSDLESRTSDRKP